MDSDDEGPVFLDLASVARGNKEEVRFSTFLSQHTSEKHFRFS